MMPAVRGPYRRPGGFLYNYFLAGLFRALGINASYVYVVQSLLLGVSVSLMYLAFRPCLAPVSGLVYLGAVALFMYADYRRFAFRLLSENLLLFLLRWAWDSRWSLPSTSDLTGVGRRHRLRRAGSVSSSRRLLAGRVRDLRRDLPRAAPGRGDDRKLRLPHDRARDAGCAASCRIRRRAGWSRHYGRPACTGIVTSVAVGRSRTRAGPLQFRRHSRRVRVHRYYNEHRRCSRS